MPDIGANSTHTIELFQKMGEPADLCRVFIQTQSWNAGTNPCKAAVDASKRGETVVFSTKVSSVAGAISGSDDTRIKGLASGLVAAGVKNFLFGIYHEPEDNVEGGEFTAAQWRQMQARLLPMVKTLIAPAGGKTISILMAWTTNPKSGRNAEDYRVPEADVQGWDLYERGGATSGTPEGVYAKNDPSQASLDQWTWCLDAAKRWGKPSLMAEFGVMHRQSDPTGKEVAGYMDRVRAMPRINEVLGIIYFEQDGYSYNIRDMADARAGFGRMNDDVVVPPEPSDCSEVEAQLAAANAQLLTTTAALATANTALAKAQGQLTRIAAITAE
jgi:hypothetical protein